MKKSNWTKEEDKLMIKELQKEGAYLNLNKCFISIATKLDRSPDGVRQHYYSKIRNQGVIFVSVSKNNAIVNTKVGDYRKSSKIEHSIWHKLINLFKK